MNAWWNFDEIVCWPALSSPRPPPTSWPTSSTKSPYQPQLTLVLSLTRISLTMSPSSCMRRPGGNTPPTRMSRQVNAAQPLPQRPVTWPQHQWLLKSSWRTETIPHMLSRWPMTWLQCQWPLKSWWRTATIPHRLPRMPVTSPQHQRLLKSSWRIVTIPPRLPLWPVTRPQPQRLLKSLWRLWVFPKDCRKTSWESVTDFVRLVTKLGYK